MKSLDPFSKEISYFNLKIVQDFILANKVWAITKINEIKLFKMGVNPKTSIPQDDIKGDGLYIN